MKAALPSGGSRAARVRRALGLSQGEVAIAAGLRWQASVSLAERGLVSRPAAAAHRGVLLRLLMARRRWRFHLAGGLLWHAARLCFSAGRRDAGWWLLLSRPERLPAVLVMAWGEVILAMDVESPAGVTLDRAFTRLEALVGQPSPPDRDLLAMLTEGLCEPEAGDLVEALSW